MRFNAILSSKINLEILTPNDITGEYINWLKNPQVNEFLEVRHEVVTLETQRKYVSNLLDSSDSYLFGMFDLSHKLIGSIKLGPINPHHKFGEVGLMIGDPEYWGKGFGTNAINILLETFFGTGTLRKATAGVMEANIASRRVFEKSGFLIEGVLQDHVIGHDGELSTVIRYSRFNQPIIENGVN